MAESLLVDVLIWGWGLLWLVAAAHALWPWINLPQHPLLRWPLTVSLSLGGLTLWLLLVGFWRLNAGVALAFPVLVLGGGLLRARQAAHQIFPRLALRLPRSRLAIALLLGGSVLALVVLGQASYYPFIADDEISRYAWYARLMVLDGRITPEIRGYPMFMSLNYAGLFLVTGQRPEQLAHLFPVLLSAATIVATAALGRRWFGERGGWTAAFVLTATPLYLYWSPNGYIDIPTGLYFVLCAYAADVWLETRQVGWALLAGLLAGLSMWVKQAGFATLPTLGLVYAWAIIQGWRAGRDWPGIWRAVGHGLLTLAVALVSGGAWYLRNAWHDGWAQAIPGPGAYYTVLADTSLANLIPFVSQFQAFGWLASPLYLAGLGWSALILVRGRPVEREKVVWVLLWGVPYTLLWWRLFSYDARFLLTVLPFYALLVGGLAAALPEHFYRHRLEFSMAVLVLAMTGAAAYQAQLGGVRQWLLAPTATYAERLYRAKSDMYHTVEFLRDHTAPDARVVSMDGRLQYYLVERPYTTAYPGTLDMLYQYDYLVVGSWWRTAYAGFHLDNSEVYAELEAPAVLELAYPGPTGNLTVYRIVKPEGE